MHDPSRFGPAARAPVRATWLLMLVVPACCAGLWAWLELGGPLENVRASERREAERCVVEARARMREALLRVATESAPFALELDGERRIVGPLVGPPEEAGDGDCVAWSVAEATGRSMLAAGDRELALPWFEVARASGSLSGEGHLVFAQCVDDEEAAAALVGAAEEQSAVTWCGPLPFELLTALVRLRLELGDPQRARGAFVEGCGRLAPGALLAVVDRVEADGLLRGDPVLAWLRAAAGVAQRFEAEAAPAAVASGAGDAAIVPWHSPGSGDGGQRLHVVPGEVAAHVAVAVVDDLRAAFDGVRIEAPHWSSERWVVTPYTTTSDRLALAARAALALGMFAFAVGMLQFWRLGRRELALAQMRQGLVDEVSHELRTPLASLALRSEMLAKGDVPGDRVAHYAASIHGDVRRLGEQVERVLEFRRLEKGGALRPERVAARVLLARGLCPVRSLLRRRRQTVEVDVSRDLPVLHVDVEIVGRALRNLLENAAKYAPEGSAVSVRVGVEGGEVWFEVGDRGPGVAAGETERVFEPFYRSPANPADVPGSGLGLAFVAKAAAAHDGRVWVVAREGGGAVFALAVRA